MSLRGHFKAVAAVDSARFLVIRYGTRYCALPSDCVRGVLTVEQACINGAVTWLGSTYPDVDLAGLLSTLLDKTSREIRTILYSNDRSHAAIRVDEVVGLVEVSREQCQPLPPQFQAEERNWIPGTITYQHDLALILNSEWVLGEIGELTLVGPATRHE